jgi:hypothetical protein
MVSIVIQSIIMEWFVAISVPFRIGPREVSGFNLRIAMKEATRIWGVVAVKERLNHAYSILTLNTTGGSLLLQLATTCSVPLESCGENVEVTMADWPITRWRSSMFFPNRLEFAVELFLGKARYNRSCEVCRAWRNAGVVTESMKRGWRGWTAFRAMEIFQSRFWHFGGFFG